MRMRALGSLLAALLVAIPAMGAGPVTLVRDDQGDRLVLDPAFGPSWQEVNIGRLVLRTPDGQTSLAPKELTPEELSPGKKQGPSATRRALAVERPPAAGCGLIIADIGPGFEKGRPDAWQRITHATKIVTCPSSGTAVLSRAEISARRHAGGMLMAKTGSRVEIQPLANPATLRPGADLPVRAFCDGDARRGVEVTAIAPDGSRRYASTDRVGVAVLRIDGAGRWSFEVACASRSAPDDAPRLVATLVVDVLSSEAWSNLGTGR